MDPVTLRPELLLLDLDEDEELMERVRMTPGELEAELSHPVLEGLRRMWDKVIPLPLEQVPSDSLVREFAGGSAFQY